MEQLPQEDDGEGVGCGRRKRSDRDGESEEELNKPMGTFTPEFVLSLGDNFYSKGVKSVDDPQFKSKYEETFDSPSLQVPWYVCSGNHDYYGGSKGIAAEASVVASETAASQ